MWNLKYDTMNIPMKPKQNHRQRENRPVVADRGQLGEGWSWRLGLADASYYVEGG